MFFGICFSMERSAVFRRYVCDRKDVRIPEGSLLVWCVRCPDVVRYTTCCLNYIYNINNIDIIEDVGDINNIE